MIAPMKKATILVLDSRREQELANLKRLGLLHPDIERRSDEKTERLQSNRELVQRAIAELPSADDVPQEVVPAAPVEAERENLLDVLESARAIHAAAEHRRGRIDVLERIETEMSRVRPWGDFDPEEIAALEARGIEIGLFSMAPKEFRKRAPEGAIQLERGPVAVRFALVWFHGVQASGRSPEEIAAMPGIQRFRIPEISLHGLEVRREEELAEIAAVEKELAALANRRSALEWALGELDRALRDEHVRLGMDTAERIAYITGYIPADSLDTLSQAASNNGWGTLIRDPDPEDPVPTRIQNPAWIRIIRPVFSLLGVVPGYRERDISFFFLLFFIVFVGMIIGDAGYGVILLVGGLLLLGKSKGRNTEGPALLLVLSLSTIAWGAMTGNWFGYEPIGELVPLRYLIVPSLDSFNPQSAQAVQAVCFVLAAMHLSIARLWNFIRDLREKPAIRAFAQLGWLSLILALYMLVLSLFLGQPFPEYGMYMVGGGIATVFIFGGQSADTGFLAGIGRGLAGAFTTVFDVIGAFSDIISYIRLFAVGLATVAIAQAFNEMAASIGMEGPTVILAIVVLIFGHTLNLIMGGLAVVVHGVRLNLLEFSGHLGMEWTGFEYQPFSENNRSAS
ncbi:MAG: V-type ATP synthase subunit I [Spirochaetota bacterium]